MARTVSLIVLTLLILFLGITFYRVITPFLLPLFLAGILATLCQPAFRFFQRRLKLQPRLSAGLTTAAVLAVILLPAAVGTLLASLQLISWTGSTVANPEWRAERRAALVQYVSETAQKLEPYLPEDVLQDATDPAKVDEAVGQVTEQSAGNLNSALRVLAQRTIGSPGTAAGVAGAAAGVAVDVLGTAASFLINGLIFVVALYYFLADGPALLAAAEGLIPLHAEYQRQLLLRFEQVIRAVILSTFLAALTQGALTAGAMWIAGFHHFWVLLMISTLSSMIPLVGTWVIWGPAAIWLAVNGSWGPALFLLVFGAAVISMMDNVIRTWVLQSDAQLHPLLAFVSVLGGLQIMGFWGVFVGPVVAACLHALVKIFNVEVQELSKERFFPPDVLKESSPAISDRTSESPAKTEPAKSPGSAKDGNDNLDKPEPSTSAASSSPPKSPSSPGSAG